MNDYDELELENEKEAEEALDALVEYLSEAMQPRDGAVRVLNPLRIDNVRLCASVLKKFVLGEDAKIEWEIHKPIESAAYISLEGKSLFLNDTRWLARVGELANNMEVYPLADGSIRMTFTFYGVMEVLN